jgi:hypothetical protein
VFVDVVEVYVCVAFVKNADVFECFINYKYGRKIKTFTTKTKNVISFDKRSQYDTKLA